MAERNTEPRALQAFEAVPPSVVRPWCAHFAEVIAKAHHVDIIERMPQPNDAFVLPVELRTSRDSLIERHGCSSPHLRWENINDKTEVISDKVIPGPSVSDNMLRHIESKDVLAVHDLVIDLNSNCRQSFANNSAFDERDPSVYVSMATAWEIIMRADQYMRHIYVLCHGATNPHFHTLVNRIVATAISSLSEVGAPSWGLPISAQAISNFWRETFPAACHKVLDAPSTLQIDAVRDLGYDHWIPIYARLNILRAAYYTLMMRAAGEPGPGLDEESRIDTALAYMA